MDIEQAPRPSAMERITAVAEQKGAERRQRILARFDRLLGAPEAAGEAMKIAGETVDDLKKRAEKRLTETARSLEERVDNAWARFTNRVTETKDKAVNKARELKDRAVKSGLSAGTWVEDKIVAVCEIPAGIMESMAAGKQAAAASGEEEYDRKIVEQMAAVAGLNAEQQTVLQALLAKQRADKQKLESKQAKGRERLQNRIDDARGKATELKAGAANQRAGVEKRRIFKGLLARFRA